MKKTKIFSLVLVLILTLGILADSAVAETVIVTSPFTAAVAEVRSSVVVVNNYQKVTYGNYRNGSMYDYFGFPFPFGGYGFDYGNRNNNQNQSEEEILSGFGSGVVIADKYVLTNYHVIEKATKVTISIPDFDTGDAEELEATVAGKDEDLDLAIVYVPDLELKPVKLGDSDKLQVGDWAIAIGNPLSAKYYGTVTVGVISALNRNITSTSYDKYGRKETTSVAMIQTDADINSGNSGGGLFSVTGELIGVPARKYSGSSSTGIDIDGISLCIPINLAKTLISEVIDTGITRIAGDEEEKENVEQNNNTLSGKPRMGITISNINRSSNAVLSGLIPVGAYVTAVDEGGPAETAGIQVGDIIVEIDNIRIEDNVTMINLIGKGSNGDVMHVKVFRVVNGFTEDTTKEDMENGSYMEFDVELKVIDDIVM